MAIGTTRRTIEDGRGREVRVESRAIGKRQVARESRSDAEIAGERAGRLDEIVDRIRRLPIGRNDLERFHEERDEICKDLMGLARDMRVRQATAGQWGRGR
ncbi:MULTISPECIES: hypothetical protein [Afifella]|uniref:hypothetical protein n=1 Tax=Afifella TaxID=643217 RepID=UPI000FE30605|nr:hypothetical protein [Afifella aestuarii]